MLNKIKEFYEYLYNTDAVSFLVFVAKVAIFSYVVMMALYFIIEGAR